VPTILLMMQRKLYIRDGLKIEGIFRINAENSEEVNVRDQLNSGVVPDEVDLHCLAGLIKAWFRELPAGVLDALTPEQVMHCNTEEDCALLASMLPPVEAALLDWAINLMADVVEHESHNKMNARNIAMVFAPNMTQMADPLTALIHAVQVMNFLKTLILKTLKERKEAAGAVQALQSCSGSPNDQDEPQMSEHLEKPSVLSSQKDFDFPMIDKATPVQVLGAYKALHHDSQSRSNEPKFGIDMDHKKSHSDVSSLGRDLNNRAGMDEADELFQGRMRTVRYRRGCAAAAIDDAVLTACCSGEQRTFPGAALCDGTGDSEPRSGTARLSLSRTANGWCGRARAAGGFSRQPVSSTGP
jgi:hypothetical protein